MVASDASVYGTAVTVGSVKVTVVGSLSEGGSDGGLST